ncbi:MAG TPA: hypothetical protein IAB96_09065 [Candidatus Coprenecus pullicola]|nr:hypothetical protein [Candidatus Coprenecus pullicola]
MKKYFVYLMMAFAVTASASCTGDGYGSDGADGQPENPENPNPSDTLSGESNILVVYFSWSGNTRHVAEYIARQTGGTLFRIEPEKPYPSEYVPCTEVAKAEKEQNARPAIRDRVEDWDSYDTVFIGCPVWWWTAPMIINTFAESYDFAGKTVVPFCTYASTYRDETLARIVELTPDARHLKGFGAIDRNTDGITEWLEKIKLLK